MTTTAHVKVTTTADQTAEVGKPFGDTAHITGTVPEGAHITFKLSHNGKVLAQGKCGEHAETTTVTTPVVPTPTQTTVPVGPAHPRQMPRTGV